MGEYTHAVLPPHSALLHILRLPSQFLKDEQTANCQLKDKLFSQPSQLFVAPQSFKCYYETAVMKISLTSINCRGEKKNKTNKRKQRGLPAAARAARQWAAKHCGSSVIRITLQDESGSVRTHTNTHTHKKICTVCLHDFSNCIMSTQEISPN